MQRNSHLDDCPCPETDTDTPTEKHEACEGCAVKSTGSNGSNGKSSIPATLTGSIRAFRDSGNIDMVEYLDEMRKTQDQAESFMKLLQKLRKRKTANYPKLQAETAVETS